MILSEHTVAAYRLRHGSSPLVVSMPHVGTFVPPSIGRELSDCAARRPDTDWHLPLLYDFLDDLDATVIRATHSRYVIDVNRPPDGSNLYPGQETPLLCPIDTFAREKLYRTADPGPAEIERRLARVWRPYHRRLQREIDRVKAAHGIALLWDAHSIASRVPRLFEGRLDDFNFGTAGGASCDPGLAEALLVAMSRHRDYSAVLDGRFKGGYITRTYGRPAEGVHAVQLEMSERVYMNEETPPYAWRPDLAAPVREVLRELLGLCRSWAGQRSAGASTQATA